MTRDSFGAIAQAGEPPARLLDVTRLISRAGRVLTGVDRVELAYLNAVLRSDVPAFGIAKTAFGFILLDETGLRALRERVLRDSWGKPDLLSHLAFRLNKSQQSAQSDLRRHALARSVGVTTMLRRHLPRGFAYLNTGHSNLTLRMLASLKALPETRIAVLLHDTIPLDFPAVQSPGSAAAFERKLLAVAALADLVICTSETCQADVTRHLQRLRRVPAIVMAHLGQDSALPDPASLPPGLDLAGPYFVALGTIEPRKNHRLLLDVWDRLAAETAGPIPRLFICGSRGWLNEDVFARLDREKESKNSAITEIAGLSDAAVAALLQGSRALLFPSLSEGFGLPPVEAAALHVPVVSGALPSVIEVLRDWPIYLDTTDTDLWHKHIGQMARAPLSRPERCFELPDWDSHFRVVFRFT